MNKVFSCGETKFTRAEVVEGSKCIMDSPISKDVEDCVLQEIANEVEDKMQSYYEYQRLGVWDSERVNKKRLSLIEDCASMHCILADEC